MTKLSFKLERQDKYNPEYKYNYDSRTTYRKTEKVPTGYASGN